jgi:hypothetical protein
VLADVRSGYVSVEAARTEYCVVIRQSGRSVELDVAATTELRGSRRDGEDLAAKNAKVAPPPSSSPAMRGRKEEGQVSPAKALRRKGDGPEAVIPSGCEGAERDFSRRSK